MLLQLRRFHFNAYAAQVAFMKARGLLGGGGGAQHRGSATAVVLPEHTSAARDHGHALIRVEFEAADDGKGGGAAGAKPESNTHGNGRGGGTPAAVEDLVLSPVGGAPHSLTTHASVTAMDWTMGRRGSNMAVAAPRTSPSPAAGAVPPHALTRSTSTLHFLSNLLVTHKPVQFNPW